MFKLPLDISVRKNTDGSWVGKKAFFSYCIRLNKTPSYKELGSFEFSIPSQFNHIYLSQGDEHLTFAVASFLAAVWISIPPIIPKMADKTIFSLAAHDGNIWWKFFTDRNGWSSKTPKWKNGYFQVDDFILGKSECSHVLISEKEVEIPMPEKAYKAKVKLEDWTWKRPRWFAQTIRKTDIEMLDGEQIPIPGKGDNSWDCGDDAIFSLLTPAKTIEEGIGLFVADVLKTRMKRMGSHRWEK